MNEHQGRILARVVDQIDEYRAGTLSPTQTLNNIWGLYTAAEIELTPEGQEFHELYLLATAADDARQYFMPEGLGTDADFEASLDALRIWATRLGEAGAGSSGRSQVNNATSMTSSQDRTDRVEVEGCIIDTETSAGG